MAVELKGGVKAPDPTPPTEIRILETLIGYFESRGYSTQVLITSTGAIGYDASAGPDMPIYTYIYDGPGTFLGIGLEGGQTPTYAVGDTVAAITFYSVLGATGYPIVYTPDLAINYKGSQIAETSSSGTKILKTAGKYMEDDVEVVYTKPEGTDVSDTTAVAADVLAPKIIHLSTGASAVGTIPTKSAADATVNQNVVTFPWGYYPSQVQKTVGIAQAAQTITPGSVNQVISSGRYLTGSQTILGDANLLSENIKSGVSIFGKMGTYEGGASTVIDPLSVVANGTYIAPSGHAYSPVSVNIDTQFGWETVPESWATGLVDKTISGSVYGSMVLQLRKFAFYDCSALENVSFPKCKIIGDTCFAECMGLISVNFSECRTIGNDAFYNCRSLLSVSFPECTNIALNAFFGCSSLAYVEFPKCTMIGQSAFISCNSLSIISFPRCVRINTSAFLSCTALRTAFFPECISIGTSAFLRCYSLVSISFPKCMTIERAAFCACSQLTMASFSQCSRIPDAGFQHCLALTSIIFPEALIIDYSACSNCPSLTFISCPKCRIIQNGAFYNCRSLPSVSFSECRFIDGQAFAWCSALSSAYFLAPALATLSHSNAFQYTPMQYSSYLGTFGSIYVRSSLVASYKAATNWTYYSARIVGYNDE